MLNLVREIWAQNRYPIPEVNEGDFIVDVGAHVGTFTVWAGSRCPSTKIIAVEPSPISAEYLRGNVNRNRLSNVSVIEAACASDNDGRCLYARGVLAMNTVFPSGTGLTGSMVQSVSLNALFEKFGIQRCALLKLDCEGAEYEILFSASPESLSRIGSIAMEYHRGLAKFDEHALADYLRHHGFVVEVGAPEDEEGGYLYAKAPDLRFAGGVTMP